MVQIRIEHLNTAIAAIRHVDETLGVGRDAVRGAELVRAGASCADRLHPTPVLVDLRDPRVAVAIAHEDVVRGIPGHVGGSVEGAGVADRVAFIEALLLPAFYEALEPADGVRFSRPHPPARALRI